MNTIEQHRRRKGCHAIAAQRARMARRQGRNRLIVMLVFLWAILSGPFRSLPVSQSDRGPSSPLPSSGHAEGGDWPVTDYERGAGGHFMRRRLPSGTGRYRSRPSLVKLMADLRRPAARRDAAAALEARIADPVIREWIAARIAKDEINRLSIWVQLGRPEANVIDAWRGEADAALDEATVDTTSPSPDRGSLLQAAKLLETLAGTETTAAVGPKMPDNI